MSYRAEFGTVGLVTFLTRSSLMYNTREQSDIYSLKSPNSVNSTDVKHC